MGILEGVSCFGSWAGGLFSFTVKRLRFKTCFLIWYVVMIRCERVLRLVKIGLIGKYPVAVGCVITAWV